MKVLKSHRDEYFLRWNQDDFIRLGDLSSAAKFGYIPVKDMQRGDTTHESETWLRMNKKQNAHLLEKLHESIPRDGMINPLILVSTQNPHWVNYVGVGKTFWSHIPFIIQTGNNRYQVARENGYTHISSIIFGPSVDPRVWNYMQRELKKPLGEVLYVDKAFLINHFGTSGFGPEESRI